MRGSKVYESEDTEITLGTGKMLALFFGLVILCATFFGMGYSMGHNSSKSTAELLPSPSTSGTRVSPIARPTVTPPPVASDTKPAETQSTAPDTTAATNTTQATTNPTAAPDQSAASAQTPITLQPGPAYFVQVAAVSKQEDAQALVESLKGRQYQAFIADPSPDKLFHVQVGPFADVKEAENMRTRLVNDGYNPILKK
jgi:cell division septation protein DedD